MNRQEQNREMDRIVKRWRKSGLTCAQFARQEGVGVWRLRYCVSKEPNSTRPAAPGSSFVPVRILPEPTQATGLRFELIFGDGRRLMIPAELTGSALRDLLGTLGSC